MKQFLIQSFPIYNFQFFPYFPPIFPVITPSITVKNDLARPGAILYGDLKNEFKSGLRIASLAPGYSDFILNIVSVQTKFKEDRQGNKTGRLKK